MTTKKKILAGDFETCANEEIRYNEDYKIINEKLKAKVWLSCLMDIETREPVNICYNIKDYIKYISKINSIIYYHNLKFDGSFILDYLVKKGFKQLSYTEYSEKKYKKKSYYIVLDEVNNWYSMIIFWDFKTEKIARSTRTKKKWLKTELIDSLKLLPMSIKDMGDKFLKLDKEDQKGTIDYNSIKPDGYIPTNEEIDYIIKDCDILSRGIKVMLDNDLNKNTISANAFKEWLRIRFKGNRDFFRAYMPELTEEEDLFIRASYKGGWTYCNPKYKGLEDTLKGLSLDVNSLYPYVMRTYPMPFGKPKYFKGKYKENTKYPIYIAKIKIGGYKLKKGKFPIISLRDDCLKNTGEYSESGIELTLTLTNIDLELIKECYTLTGVKYIEGYMFSTNNDFFNEYVDYYGNMKINAKSKEERLIAKLMLNSLYGKFGSRPIRTPKKISLSDEGVIKTSLDLDNEYMVTPYYIPVASFITAYARRETIKGALDNYDNFIYADTDSLHLNIDIEDLNKVNLNIDKDFTGELGLWKIENIFLDSKFLGAKRYIEYGYDYKEYVKEGKKDIKWDIKCAGLPKDLHSVIKGKEDFKVGAIFEGKNASLTVDGGRLIVKGLFTINELD